MNPQPYQLSFLRPQWHQGIAPPHIFPNRLLNLEVRSCSGICTSGKKKLRPKRPDALDALDASDTTCLTQKQFAMAPYIGTQLTTAPCIQTQLATASAYRTERLRAFSFWTQPCWGIFLLDAAMSGHFPSGRCRVRANGIWTMRVMAPRSRWLSRYGTSPQILLSHSQTHSGFQAQ